MGNLVSTLTLRLVDGVSAVAGKIDAALRKTNSTAKGMVGSKSIGGAAGGAGGAGTALLAGGGRMVLGALGAYAGAGAAKDAYLKYADYDRQITRILITAEASGEEAAKTRQTIRDIARETALPIANVTAGLDTLVAAGRTLPDALAFLPAVSRTAQAAGADVMDIAKSADALGAALKIPSDQMEIAFDKMAKAGKLGKFELKDMAQHLASLLPLAASKGFKGMEGLEKVVSYLQMIRQGTGSSDEAADSFRDMMGKIASTETVNKFKKFGIDVKKELAEVRKAGGNEFDAMFGSGGLMERAMKKGAQVTDLFSDVQAYRGALAFRNALADLPKYLQEIKNAAGTVMTDLGRVTRDAAAATARMGNAWDDMLRSFGNTADAAGVTTLLESIAKNNNDGAAAMERFVAALKEGKSIMDSMRAASGMDKMTPDQIQERFEREMTGTGQTVAEIEQRRSVKSAVADGAAARKRAAKALKEAQRLGEIASRYPDGKLPPILQTQRDAVEAELKRAGIDEADQRLVDVAGGQDYTDESRRGWAKTKGGSPDLPMPRAQPAPLTTEARVELEAEAAKQKARETVQQIQQIFDGLVIRPRLDMPSIPTGGLSSAANGSPTDNGGRR